MRARRIVPVIPLKTIFAEDPVRMIRAVKYAVATGFTIPFMTTRWLSSGTRRSLAGASVSRLGEEALKILYSANASAIIELAGPYYRLLAPSCPASAGVLASGRRRGGLDAGGTSRNWTLMSRDTGDKSLGGPALVHLRLPVRRHRPYPRPTPRPRSARP